MSANECTGGRTDMIAAALSSLDGVAVITLDNPPVNGLGYATPASASPMASIGRSPIRPSWGSC